jgi:hypothetical protein
MVPFYHSQIDAPPWQASAAVEDGASKRIQTHVFGILE